MGVANGVAKSVLPLPVPIGLILEWRRSYMVTGMTCIAKKIKSGENQAMPITDTQHGLKG